MVLLQNKQSHNVSKNLSIHLRDLDLMKNLTFYFVFAGIFLACSFYGGEIVAESDITIDAQTDKSSYDDGARVTVSGNIDNFDSETHSNTALTYRALDPEGNIVSLGQTTPNAKGFFSFNFDVGGSFFKEIGNYPIQLYFESIKKEIFFTYNEDESELPSSEITFDSDTSDKKLITILMDEQSTFFLDSPNKIIRASIEIQNYTPSDGQYFMTVTHVPTQKILKESVIYPKSFGNDLWAVQIAYLILESDLKLSGQILTGEFEIHIRTEFNSQTASATFFILESSSKSPLPTTSESNIPDWIKNTAAWWADDKITETEFLGAIEYLIEKNVITISNSKNENIPSITTTYSLPSSRSTTFAEITGSLPEKHEGTLTLTVVQPDQSEETITTISRDGTFMTIIALTNESLQGTYQIFAEIEGNQILVSAFNVKDNISSKVPEWIKNNADWWAQSLISDEDFVKGIEYLIDQRIITV
jgi:hypothetical protein